MNTTKQRKLRELTNKELKAVSGGLGLSWGKYPGGGFYIQSFFGKRPGKG